MTATLQQRMLRDERLRFLIVGALNTAFAYLLFTALVVMLTPAVHYTVLLIATHVLTVLTAYVMHRTWVFHVRGNFWRDLPRYWAVQLGVLGANLAALPLLVEIVGVPILLAQALVVVSVAVLGYLGHRHVSFRRALQPRAAHPADEA